jgi:hypothetical protein
MSEYAVAPGGELLLQRLTAAAETNGVVLPAAPTARDIQLLTCRGKGTSSAAKAERRSWEVCQANMRHAGKHAAHTAAAAGASVASAAAAAGAPNPQLGSLPVHARCASACTHAHPVAHPAASAPSCPHKNTEHSWVVHPAAPVCVGVGVFCGRVFVWAQHGRTHARTHVHAEAVMALQYLMIF